LFGFQSLGDYATFNSNHTPDGTPLQRARDSLAAAGKVQSFGRGRARRWTTPPVPGFTTTLLFPAPLPSD
jgi:hypothetical protein